MIQSTTDGCVSEVCEIKANGAKDCEETKEQRIAREAEERRESKCKTKRRAAMLKELALLEKFPKRADIDTERDKELATNMTHLERVAQEYHVADKRLAELRIQAEFYGPKHAMPAELADRIEFATKLPLRVRMWAWRAPFWRRERVTNCP